MQASNLIPRKLGKSSRSLLLLMQGVSDLQRQAHYSGVRDRQIDEEATWPNQLLSTPASKQTQDDQVSLSLVCDSDSGRSKLSSKTAGTTIIKIYTPEEKLSVSSVERTPLGVCFYLFLFFCFFFFYASLCVAA